MSRLLVAGFVRLHVLYHASRETICGVEMIAELAEHGYRLSPGTIYPIFHEMEQAGFLSGRTKVVSGKSRRYYVATARGRRALEAAKDKLRELAAEVLDDKVPRKRRR